MRNCKILTSLSTSLKNTPEFTSTIESAVNKPIAGPINSVKKRYWWDPQRMSDGTIEISKRVRDKHENNYHKTVLLCIKSRIMKHDAPIMNNTIRRIFWYALA